MSTTDTTTIVMSHAAGLVQAGDVVRLPGERSFRKVFEATNANPSIDNHGNVKIHFWNRVAVVSNQTEIEYLIEVLFD